MSTNLTRGVHHIGLAVLDLHAAQGFFVEALGWTVVGGNAPYPAVFVSDGTVLVTLWRVADPDQAVRFDRRANVGLHHLAISVADNVMLEAVFDRVRAHPGVSIEFPPGPIWEGSSMHHFICAMPGGVRLEFATAPT